MHRARSLVERAFPQPLGAKVPEVATLFFVVKILTTAGGEAVSDHFALGGRLAGGAFEVGVFLLGLLWQFRTRRYTAAAYWFFAYSIAIFGTGVADFQHLYLALPYLATTVLWAVVLAVVFFSWWKSEGTLSVHSITARRREAFYWATVFSTFALGTALGDFTAAEAGIGFLASGVLLSLAICVPWLLRVSTGLNGVLAFWAAYVLTRPLGASYADYLDKPPRLSGAGYGPGQVAIVLSLLVAFCVAYLAVTRRDIQSPGQAPVPSHEAVSRL